MSPPLFLRYEGDGVFKAHSDYWVSKADAEYSSGQTYRMVEHQDRSSATHNHYFASIADAWGSIPDDLLAEYPSAEHLRKKMLVKTGYADERSIVCASRAEALRVAAFIIPIDSFAVVIVKDAVVRVCTAQSQSHRGMGKQEFAASKERVLNAIHELIGLEAAA